MNTYISEGGIGKQIAFTAVIDALVKKDKEQLQVYTHHQDIFRSNPNVKNILDANVIIPEHDKRILESEDIFFCDPYRSNFIKGKIHIIQSYCELFGIKYEEKMYPKIFTDHYKADAKQVVGDDEFIVIQFSGGQNIINFHPQIPHITNDWNRNYPPFFVEKVIGLIKDKHEDLKILNFSFSNEPTYKETERLNPISFAQWHEILKRPNCKGFISIDSCLQHFASSAGRRGVVIWGGSRWTQLGYKQNINLNKWWSEWNEWDNEKFELQDPRNIMVEPELVFEQFEKIYGKELISV